MRIALPLTILAATALLPLAARADDFAVSVREYPSWSEVIVAVNKEPLAAGTVLHVRALTPGGEPVACDRYELELSLRLNGVFRIQRCEGGVTELLVTDPQALPAGAPPEDVQLHAMRRRPDANVDAAPSSSPARTTARVVSPPSDAQRQQTRANLFLGWAAASCVLSFPGWMATFYVAGYSVTDSAEIGAIVAGGTLGASLLLFVLMMPGGNLMSMGRLDRPRGFEFAGAAIAPTADGQGAVGTVVLRF